MNASASLRDGSRDAAHLARAAGFRTVHAAVVCEGDRFLPNGSTGVPIDLSRGVSIDRRPDLVDVPVLRIRPPEDDYVGSALTAVRAARLLGARRLLVLADAEAIAGTAGPMALVADHVNLRADNPLVGPNDAEFGPRFPDMSDPYDAGIRDALHGLLDVDEVIVASTDETDAVLAEGERAAWAQLGIEAVTRGVAPSAIAARHAGMQVVGAVAFDTVPDTLLRALVHGVLASE